MLKMKPSYQKKKNGWDWDLYTFLVGGIKDFFYVKLTIPESCKVKWFCNHVKVENGIHFSHINIYMLFFVQNFLFYNYAIMLKVYTVHVNPKLQSWMVDRYI